MPKEVSEVLLAGDVRFEVGLVGAGAEVAVLIVTAGVHSLQVASL